jgi:hypothetical protein
VILPTLGEEIGDVCDDDGDDYDDYDDDEAEFYDIRIGSSQVIEHERYSLSVNVCYATAQRKIHGPLFFCRKTNP